MPKTVQKGILEKKETGRQVARMMVHQYKESIVSHLYPGNTHSTHALIPALDWLEHHFPTLHRHKTILRLDGGFGGDENISELVARGYQLIAKGASHRRAKKLSTQVSRWQSLRSDRWVGRVETPISFERQVWTYVLRNQKSDGSYKHAYIYATLQDSAKGIIRTYDLRGGAETEFRTDKSGLKLKNRRKHKRDAQEMWLLLTDMVHNYVAMLSREIFHDSQFCDFGAKRIAEQLLHIPGTIEFENDRLLSVNLSQDHPNSAEMLACLARFWE